MLPLICITYSQRIEIKKINNLNVILSVTLIVYCLLHIVN